MKKTWNQRLVDAMQKRGVKQSDLARMTGVSNPTVHAWMTDQVSLRAENKAKIDAALNLRPEYLLDGACELDGASDSALARAQRGETGPPPRLTKQASVPWGTEHSDPAEQEFYALVEALNRDELIECLATAAAILSRQDQIELAERILRGVREELAPD